MTRVNIDLSTENIHKAIIKTVKQGKRCIDERDACMYQHGENRCVVGHMVDDANIKVLVAGRDGINAFDVFDTNNGEETDYHQNRLLADLQYVHDHKHDTMTPEQWLQEFNMALDKNDMPQIKKNEVFA